ncbi:hypothetical protein [Pseudomonas defluvii]|uniref:hypothetical protein n=1 Tax=Pseudomonas defluvii TaxID=1876757 RepID=UPI000A6419A5|nr:hypothetical protein [Pseudomonas defluvii]
MNLENFSSDKVDVPSKLALLAQETPDKSLNLADLDKPMVLTQESRLELPEVSAETRDRLENLGYPEEVLDVIGSEAEARIYEDANLEPAEVNGKDALIRTDIDYDQKDMFKVDPSVKTVFQRV